MSNITVYSTPSILADSSFLNNFLDSLLENYCSANFTRNNVLKENLNTVQNLTVSLKDNSFIVPHISKNEFKQNTTFITYRSKQLKDFFEFDKYVYDALENLKILTSKAKLFYEVCVYDTNKELDKQWMKQHYDY